MVHRVPERSEVGFLRCLWLGKPNLFLDCPSRFGQDRAAGGR